MPGSGFSHYPHPVPSPTEPADPPGLAGIRAVAVTGHPGTQVRVEVHHPDAPVIALFQAGLGLPLEVWHPVVERLAGICCILTDRPGLGGSTPWAHAPRLADQVSLIGDVLDACSPDAAAPVALVGHSYAGILVEAFARTHPARVCALVLVDPSLPGQEVASTTLVERFPDEARGLAASLPGLGRWLGSALVVGGTTGLGMGHTAASRSIADAYALPTHQLAAVDELLAIGGEAAELIELSARCPLPDVPIGVIAATRRGGPLPLPKDGWAHALADRARELGPRARAIRVEGAHLLMLDNPRELARSIEDVVTAVAAPDP